MTKTMPISKARVNLGSVIKRVREKDERVILQKNGIPVAVILDIDDYEDFLELNDPEIQARIEKSYKEFKAGKWIPAEKVMAEVRKKFPLKSKGY